MSVADRLLAELAILSRLQRTIYRRFLISILLADGGFLSLLLRRDVAPDGNEVATIAAGLLSFTAFVLGMRDSRDLRLVHERIRVLTRALRSAP